MSLQNRARAMSIKVNDQAQRISEFTAGLSQSYGKSLEYPELRMHHTSPPPSPVLNSEESFSSPELFGIDVPLIVMDDSGTTKKEGIFNTINILMGISILTLPFALHLSGIIVGVGLFITYSLVTNYTGKLLGKCLQDPHLKTYSDIAYEAFGKYGSLVSIVFILELLAAGVALLILVEDSVSVFTNIDGKFIKFLAFLTATPFLWSNSLKLLSYTSLVGIATFVYLLFLLIGQGLLVHEQPGSLINPKAIRIYPNEFWNVWLASGLIMASYAGHGCTPSVFVDLKNKKEFPSLLNTSYLVVFTVYICVAVCGYLMFGELVDNEITISMSKVTTYSRLANNVLISLMIIGPLTKYPLVVRPITTNLEYYLSEYFGRSFTIWRNICRTLASALILMIALLFPSFERVMGVVGSLFSFVVSVILPCIFYLRICHVERKEKLMIMVIIAASIPISILGTIAAFQ
eukprot:NODE_158_length_16653_cov_0.456929.p3 type:complete len:461 gc:universal NODE_158_length_16653_cov_0.456929:11398-12780(+)